MDLKTTDLCDEFGDAVRVAEPVFRDYGGQGRFAGPIATVRVLEDNVLVRQQLETPGDGRVLVVDGGGSRRCALLGDRLAQLGHDNGWSGIVVFGCIRDSVDIATIPIGVKALATHPKKSRKQGKGEVGVTVEFAGISFTAGEFLYADEDGIIVAATDLHQP